MNCMDTLLRKRLHGAKRLAILGAGSILKADDAAGVLVVKNLQAALVSGKDPELLFCVGETAPENFTGKIKRFGPDHLLVLDAADLGREAGAIVEIRPEAVGGPTFCSHMLPLRVMIDYLVRETGVRVTLLGIQYKSIAFDADMTPEVLDAVDTLSSALQGVIGELRGIG